MAIWPSILASGAPRQWCTPPRPNARCLLGSLARSRVSGSSKCYSSRLAEPRTARTSSPGGTVVPQILRSRRA
jgi:hypothetical protein